MRAGNPTPVHVESLAKVQHARTDLRSLNIRRERRHRWTAERRALLRIRGDHPFFGTLALFVVAVFECLQLLRQALWGSHGPQMQQAWREQLAPDGPPPAFDSDEPF
jgi:hypothetical protein